MRHQQGPRIGFWGPMRLLERWSFGDGFAVPPTSREKKTRERTAHTYAAGPGSGSPRATAVRFGHGNEGRGGQALRHPIGRGSVRVRGWVSLVLSAVAPNINLAVTKMSRRTRSRKDQTSSVHLPKHPQNAQRKYERYLELARAEARSGDLVAAENFLQHAEHYLRSMHESRGARSSR
jgi:Domain of unknown function (DUF4167)